ncbi:hypothetical protein P8625_14375 [Tenacibaculum tangerinum]|uniref:Lipoprotein n=1 Tax=Tenacibaculum tangerinum TaxID=3038772 RepID=A0ABY8L3N9_9FLAO|nr:hypothetical protein [Tenacibaculum tangerinum]WGH75242.1 hypothetical protein P8625_14375 [Tenacibaculum tangerinum]
MKRRITLLLSIFFFFNLTSCKTNRENIEKEFYYPHSSDFSLNENYQYVDLRGITDFNQLVDSLQSLNYEEKRAYLKIYNNKTRYNVLVSTTFGKCYPIFIKRNNVLSISRDSLKKEKSYPIHNLKNILKKDFSNFGKDYNYSNSPEQLIISLTCKISELDSLIVIVCKTFNEIKQESSDSLM